MAMWVREGGYRGVIGKVGESAPAVSVTLVI